MKIAEADDELDTLEVKIEIIEQLKETRAGGKRRVRDLLIRSVEESDVLTRATHRDCNSS